MKKEDVTDLDPQAFDEHFLGLRTLADDPEVFLKSSVGHQNCGLSIADLRNVSDMYCLTSSESLKYIMWTADICIFVKNCLGKSSFLRFHQKYDHP